MKYKCEKCPKSFSKQRDLDSHYDEHTPYWKGKTIKLSGADQIRLLLKNWYGGWEKIIKDEQKRVNKKGYFDLNKMERLRDFEKENNIKFIVNSDKVESYLELSK